MMSKLLATGGLLTVTAALSFGPIQSPGDDPFSGINPDITDKSVGVGVSKVINQVRQAPKKIATTGSQIAQGVAEQAVPARAAQGPPTILQSYCFTLSGTGQLDCFAMEQQRCTEPGSQLLVRAELDNSMFGASRNSQPFCSQPIQPTEAEPAEPVEGEEAPPPMPVVTLADFQQLNIAPSTIQTDSGGFGLRNAHTNFYASSEPQTLNVQMLGQDVAIQAVPVQWTWNYGDGSPARTLGQPGAAQTEFNQELDTTHVYEDTGQYPVRLTTAYRGQYSVNDGPWLPIPGTAQVPSTPVTADIWRSKTKNVAENCAQNPTGWACGNPFVED